MKQIPRRDFLKVTAGTAGGILAGRALGLELLLPVADPMGAYPYRGWETFYVDQIAFDYQGRTTHSVNCTGSCTWKGYVRNGILFKEEQFADYPAIDPDPADPSGMTPKRLPVYNPRGCQKGANHKEYIYGAQRVKQPLIRVGARGGGRWRVASWAEALDYIAQKVVAHIKNDGPDTVHFYAAIPAKHHITVAGGFRLSNLIGAVAMSFYDWYSDLPPGEPQTWGVQTDSCESADWFNSKLIWLQGANLLETRIPDAHYFTEARAKGTKIVAFFPEYAPVSIHADVYVPIKPGTDAAMNMAAANYIVSNNLHDAFYVKRYTDLPFLVRTDTGKFLRQSDLAAGGSPDQFFFWDMTSNRLLAAPGCAGSPDKTLVIGGADPALAGTFSVALANGSVVMVEPVFAILKRRLAPFTPAAVSAITGIDAGLITQLAQQLATVKPARIIEGAGTNHWFHNDLINRTQILVLALTGNVGKPGTGFDHYVGQEKIWPEAGWFNLAYPKGRPNQRFQNTTLWTFVHGEMPSDIDSLLPATRPDGSPGGIRSYIRESVSKWWMPLWPFGTLDNGRTPKVMFIWGANYVNQAKGSNFVINKLLPKLDLVVDLNFRMDTSANYADVVLPVASHYEKWDLNSTDLHSYIHPFTPVIDPQFDSKTDWQVWRGLAAAIQSEAIRQNFLGFQDTQTKPDGSPLFDVFRDLAHLSNDFDTLRPGGVLPLPGVGPDKAACQYILDNAVETAGFTVDSIGGLDNRVPNPVPTEPTPVPPRSHPRRFVATSEAWTSEMKAGVPYYGFQRMFEENKPLTTLAGRQQFYIDHDWYVNELDEALPTFKPPVESDKYPLRWITPHGRWSIHSTWRDAKMQLRMQRGRPICYLSPADAAARGLVDNDLVKIFNDHGTNVVHLCISNRIPNGMVQMYHGWERHTMGGIFLETTNNPAPGTNHGSWQAPTVVRIKPTQLAAGYGQLTFRLNYWGPTGNQKDTRVQVVKA
ncbi:MAG TPA: molybdopterin-dependent oxidoreductase [Anaeromyxobacteraceae bacterium]|nr:molybdopterin-dependent oxidoreductase [Anaeromyxobacteraceae bacterium]